MPIITINPPDLGSGKTRLSSNVAASASSSTVDNNDNFATGDYIIFGKIGQEKSEVILLTSITSNDTLGHTSGPAFAHAARTPVYEVKYNQVQIVSASTESGNYSVLATIDLDFDEEYTLYDDTAGTSATWYKIRYYDEDDTLYSSYSDAVQGTGYTEESLYSMTEEILDEFGDKDAAEITRKKVATKLRAGVRKITREIMKINSDYRRAYTTQALTASTATYDLPDRFISFIRVDVNYGGSVSGDASKVETFEDESEGNPETIYNTIDPRVFIRGDQFGLKPTPTSSSGYAFLWYFDYPSHMIDPADVHGLPYGARELLITYALYRLWLPKNSDKSALYKVDFNDDIDEYVEFAATSRQSYTNKKVQVSFGSDMYSNEI